jgi:Rrf2 family protein
MQLTRAADYGVRVMMHLVTETSGTRASLTDLASVADVSPAFLSKVLQRLVRAGLLTSRRGKRGGFELPERGRGASLYDVLEALDGLPALNVCLLDGGCHRSTWCAAHSVWIEAQNQMRETLRRTSVQSLGWESRTRRLAMVSQPGVAVEGNGRGNGHAEGGDGWFPVES